LSSRQIQTAIRDSSRPDAPQGSSPVEAALPVNKSAAPAKGSVLVVGVDKLLTVLAKCCKPAPPDPIVGFVTRGRGVTVHRRQCANLANLSQERLIEAQWGADAAKGVFPVDIEVDATSRPELMRDVLDVFTREKVRVSAAHSQAREPDARLLATLEVAGLDQLRRLLAMLRELPGVTGARRL
jgi:GTP pyrophosphokinase